MITSFPEKKKASPEGTQTFRAYTFCDALCAHLRLLYSWQAVS